ncbi:response regulator [Paramagnetospirillum magneticum]|uniref:histidine kinase n=1 Tax=Paramagnetospirillum magneticum (strain ATCC 700264 / AMB-1) TaxID=342108 RepID=Q2W0E3_PARM1|nr:response regulator [Paramagnetospirillum magneticum]BAE52682.1 Sensor protein gacS [Paramagnetospirillum magneticum AMB-1]
MRSSQVRIVTRLTAGFAAVLLLTVIMAGMAARTMLSIADLAGELYTHPFAVTNALMQIESQVNAMRADMLLMIYNRSAADVARLSGSVAIKESEMAASLEVVRKQYLGNPEDVKRLSDELAQWKVVRDQNIRFCQEGEYDKASENSRKYGSPQIVILRRHIAGIYAFAQDKAAEFRNRITAQRDQAVRDIALTLLALLILGTLLARTITRSIVIPLGELRDVMHRLAKGELDAHVPNQSRVTEVSRMALAVEVFKQAALRLERDRWIKDNLARLSPALQQTDSIAEFGTTALDFLVPLSGAGVATFNARTGGNRFMRVAGWGMPRASETLGLDSFAPGEGVAGEAARSGSPILIEAPPESWLHVTSATGAAAPAAIFVMPVMSRGTALAVLEFASFTAFDDSQKALLEAALPMLALNIEILERNLRTLDLLEESQTQAEELKASEEELRAQGEALQVANEELRVSEEELKVQQEALQTANEELRLKSEALEERGKALEDARAEADRRALDVEQASRYKSEFLANMSHELRTPLNSVLILARDLADNDTGNMSDDQVESARVIHESGTHLLALINDVLDLSKVEAGKMTLDPVTIAIADLVQVIRGRFAPVATDKGLGFQVEVDPDLPRSLKADRGKIEQIANNLVSNAIKFTSEGGVTVRLSLTGDGHVLALSVADTGIGIAPQDRQRVFAAFEQADSGTSRQFGGTGLGLTISRKLARLMGGDITLDANGDKGSVFTLLLPLAGTTQLPAPRCAPEPRPASARPSPPAAEAIEETPKAEGKLLLVIEDDPIFRRVVCDMAQAKGFATATAGDGKTGLELARLRRPSGVVLDIGLPDMSGWEVIEALKLQPETRDIPVHVMSAGDEPGRAARLGTVGHLTKPVSREQINGAFEVLLRARRADGRRRLLLVDGDEASRATIGETLVGLDLDITVAETGQVALEHLAAGPFDCMVLDLALSDMAGGEFLERAERIGSGLPPVIVYSSQELSQDQTLRIREFTDSIVIKGSRSSERLLDEVGLFLHAVDAKKSGKAKPSPVAAEPVDAILAGRTALLVDDDMRNAFALSKVLRARGLKVLIAQDGAKALSQLQSRADVDLVLMDIMMPGMDGYQTMGEIRKDPRFAHLPIIALTAKAMAGDRDRCLAAGADDYLTKPVDVERLRQVMALLIRRGDHAQPS